MAQGLSLDDNEEIFEILGAVFRVAVDADDSDGVSDGKCANEPKRCISRETNLGSYVLVAEGCKKAVRR